LDERLTGLICIKPIVAKTGTNLAESCKEDYGTESGVSPMMMMMVI
jgi:hypothetical protein